MSAEEVYLLDNLTYVKIDFFASLRGHYRLGRTQDTHLIGKEVQYAFHCGISYRYAEGFSFPAVQIALSQGTGLFGNCLKSYPREGE